MSLLSELFGSGQSGQSLDDLMTRLARQATPQLEGEFFKRLLSASLRVASPSLESQGLAMGAHAADESTAIRFLGTTDPEGRQSVMAFTGDEALRSWRPVGCDTVEMRVPQICAMALSAGLESMLINRGSPNCCLLSREQMQELAQGRAPLPAGLRAEKLAAADIVFSKPPQPPQELCDALKAQAALHNPIQKVYLVAAAMGAQPARGVIAVELDAGADLDSVIPAFVAGATARLQGRGIPDVMPLTAGDALGRAAREHGVLAYAR